jgi:hypothetical protein
VPEVGLQRPGIDPVIGQLEAAGVPQHVGVHLDPKLCGHACALDHTVEAFGRQRRPALGDEDEAGRCRAFPLEAPKLPQLPPGQGMGGRRTALEPVDMDLAPIEVDLLPFQVRHLGGAEAVPVRHEDHQRVAGAVAVAAGGLDEPFHLGVGQVLALAQVPVRRTPRRLRSDCPVFSAWRHQPQVRTRHEPRAPRLHDCPETNQKQDSVSRLIRRAAVDSNCRRGII